MKRVLNALVAWLVYPLLVAALLFAVDASGLVLMVLGLGASLVFLEDLSGRPSERRGAVR